MAETTTEGIPAILTMLVTVFTAVIEALKQVIPLGVETALLFLSEILAAFVGFFRALYKQVMICSSLS